MVSAAAVSGGVETLLSTAPTAAKANAPPEEAAQPPLPRLVAVAGATWLALSHNPCLIPCLNTETTRGVQAMASTPTMAS